MGKESLAVVQDAMLVGHAMGIAEGRPVRLNPGVGQR